MSQRFYLGSCVNPFNTMQSEIVTVKQKKGKLKVPLAWGNYVEMNFCKKVLQITLELGWKAEQCSHLMACIAFETGGSFEPYTLNHAGSGAVGLIQFMPFVAKELGTTSDELAKMSAVEQLEYVKKYFWRYRKRIRNLEDMYMAILLPKYCGKPNDTVIISEELKPTRYKMNIGLDVNKDGNVTKAEACLHVAKLLTEGMTEDLIRIMEI